MLDSFASLGQTPETMQRRKDLFWLTVSEVSVHYDGKGLVEYNLSYHRGQDAKKREKGAKDKILSPRNRPQ
jgi:hypothetical protein